jgi:hypothetical protein
LPEVAGAGAAGWAVCGSSLSMLTAG